MEPRVTNTIPSSRVYTSRVQNGMKESSLFTPGTLAPFQIGKSVLIGTLFYTIRAMSQSLEIPANLGAKGYDCTGRIAAIFVMSHFALSSETAGLVVQVE